MQSRTRQTIKLAIMIPVVVDGLLLIMLCFMCRLSSKDMDIYMDFTLPGNTSHEAGQVRLEGTKRQGLNHSDPLDMFTGMELLLQFKALFLPLYCLIVAVAGVGNTVLLACILADKKLHNATNFFIGNLAAGDLLMCLSCVPLTVSYAFDSHGWAFGRPLCHLVPLVQCATVFASVLSLTAIAVDRYVVVGKGPGNPCKYTTYCCKKTNSHWDIMWTIVVLMELVGSICAIKH